MLRALGLEKRQTAGCLKISGGERQLMLLGAGAGARMRRCLSWMSRRQISTTATAARVMERVQQLGRQGYTIIFSTHDPNQAFSYATKVLALKDGGVMASGRAARRFDRGGSLAALRHSGRALRGADEARHKNHLHAHAGRGGGQLMFRWTDDMVRFMRDAAGFGSYQTELAGWICSQIPQARHVCDAGCGLGFLALQLAQRYPRVTAADISEQALDIAHAQAEEKRVSNLEIVQTDLLAYAPRRASTRWCSACSGKCRRFCR